MKRLLCSALVAGVSAWTVVAAPIAAHAQPRALTAEQMDAFTAGGWKADLRNAVLAQLNVAVLNQVAVAVPIAIAVCVFRCGSVTASASGSAGNIGGIGQGNN
jgi:hypothetical protein